MRFHGADRPAAQRLMLVEETRQVKEDGRRETDGIDAVEHAGMASDERACVRDTSVTLDRRHHHAARKANEADRHRHAAGFPNVPIVL